MYENVLEEEEERHYIVLTCPTDPKSTTWSVWKPDATFQWHDFLEIDI